MKKFIYLLVFVLASVSLGSCTSSSSVTSSDKYQIKNIKFQNQTVVLSHEYMEADDVH